MPNNEINMDVQGQGSASVSMNPSVDDAAFVGRAEAWAVGKRNGTDVPSTDPAYHNNAKYYATEAAASAADAHQYTAAAVHTWLENNVDPETGYVLDRTLSEKLAAAPADMVGDLKSAIDVNFNHLRSRTYNLIDCTTALNWQPLSGKDVSVSIPSDDTVRIKSNVSQTYAGAFYLIDTSDISTLYIRLGSYSGTGTARARLMNVVNGKPGTTNIGSITTSGNTYDVSSYNLVAVTLEASTSTAGSGYIDYKEIVVADSDEAVAYTPYYTYIEGAETLEPSVDELDDAVFEKSYNLVDCNSAENWEPASNKNVTVLIPADDTVRIVSNVSQTYASAKYHFDTSNISHLYCSLAGYGGTGAARARLYGVSGSTYTNIGTILIKGSVFDVSAYSQCAVELCASTGTAAAGYMDYSYIIVADSETALPYMPYYVEKQSRISIVENKLNEFAKTIGAAQDKLYMIHRGARQTAPENTMPAFILARELGFKYVETDVRYTSDGVPVLIHDATINRTARNADGTTISTEINIADITYAEALQYDFGIYKGSQYAGTKIPTLAEFLFWCKATGTIPVLEQKLRSLQQVDAVIDALINADITTNFISLSQGIGSLERIYDRLPKGKYFYLINAAITQTDVADAAASKADLTIVGNYTTFTSDTISWCKASNIPLYGHLYLNFSDIYNTDHYVSGYVIEEGAI